MTEIKDSHQKQISDLKETIDTEIEQHETFRQKSNLVDILTLLISLISLGLGIYGILESHANATNRHDIEGCEHR